MDRSGESRARMAALTLLTVNLKGLCVAIVSVREGGGSLVTFDPRVGGRRLDAGATEGEDESGMACLRSWQLRYSCAFARSSLLVGTDAP